MRSNPPGKSLYLNLGFIIFATVTLIMSLSAGVTYYTTKSKIIEGIQKNVQLSLAALQQNTANLMEAYAVAEYQKLILTEMSNHQHFAIIIHDYNMGRILGREALVTGYIRQPHGELLPIDPANLEQAASLQQSYQLDEAKIQTSQGEIIGKIQIFNTDLALTKELNQIIRDTIFKTLSLSFLLVLALFAAIRVFLLQHLSKIIGAVGYCDEDGIPLDQIPTNGPKEIHTLAETMNRMLDAIRLSRNALMEQHQMLQRERDRFELAIDGTNDGLWDWDLQTNQVLRSPRFETMLGYEVGELPPGIECWSSLLHPEDAEQAHQKVTDYLNTKGNGTYESTFRMATKSGEWRWIIGRGKALFADDGTPLRFVGFNTDITELKNSLVQIEKQAEALRISSLQMHNILSALPDHYYRFDARGQLLDIHLAESNPRFQHSQTWTSIFDVFPKSCAAQLQEAIQKAILHNQNSTLNFSLNQSQRETFYEARIFSTGKAGVIALVREITAQHNLLEEQKRAREAAEAAYQVKSNFLSTMSHEIRTPMNGILGIAQLLMDEPLDSDTKNLVSMLLNSGRALLEIINDILDYSKLEAGRMQLYEEDLDLSFLLSNLSNLYFAPSKLKNLDYRIQIQSDIPTQLLGDSHQLQKILSNLIGNAIKFTQNGFVEVRVLKVAELPEAKVLLRFEIEDTGIGIPENEQEIIFEAFTQSDSSYRRKYGGTGLGLSIAKNLVVLMGGRIGVSSQVMKGSTFWFEVPLIQLQATQKNQVLPQQLTLPMFQEKLPVLLVEDDEVNQIVIRAMLEKLGCHVTLANHGEEGVRLALSQEFAMIFMDCLMPVMDGYHATTLIRQAEQTQDQHRLIIAISAKVQPGDQEHCQRVGMNDFIAKPIDFIALQTMVQRYGNAYFQARKPH